jgi:hypothetical protein
MGVLEVLKLIIEEATKDNRIFGIPIWPGSLPFKNENKEKARALYQTAVSRALALLATSSSIKSQPMEVRNVSASVTSNSKTGGTDGSSPSLGSPSKLISIENSGNKNTPGKGLCVPNITKRDGQVGLLINGGNGFVPLPGGIPKSHKKKSSKEKKTPNYQREPGSLPHAIHSQERILTPETVTPTSSPMGTISTSHGIAAGNGMGEFFKTPDRRRSASKAEKPNYVAQYHTSLHGNGAAGVDSLTANGDNIVSNIASVTQSAEQSPRCVNGHSTPSPDSSTSSLKLGMPPVQMMPFQLVDFINANTALIAGLNESPIAAQDSTDTPHNTATPISHINPIKKTAEVTNVITDADKVPSLNKYQTWLASRETTGSIDISAMTGVNAYGSAAPILSTGTGSGDILDVAAIWAQNETRPARPELVDNTITDEEFKSWLSPEALAILDLGAQLSKEDELANMDPALLTPFTDSLGLADDFALAPPIAEAQEGHEGHDIPAADLPFNHDVFGAGYFDPAPIEN